MSGREVFKEEGIDGYHRPPPRLIDIIVDFGKLLILADTIPPLIASSQNALRISPLS